MLAEYREGRITAQAGALELGVSVRWFRKLFSDYLQACAQGHGEEWCPGTSGGNRSRSIPEEVEELWRRMLGAGEPAPYGFAASEAYRRFGFDVDRATVRRWAQANGLAHPKSAKKEHAPVKRWQCQEVGALWQMDASPHRWFGRAGAMFPMIEIVDDCSRVIVGARLYGRELLLSYLDLLPRAFEQYGLPLAMYVDYHSFFFAQVPDHLTYLGWALKFYDITLRYAPTPQAKGKVERHHQYWQNRLPGYFEAESVRDIVTANRHLDQLRAHHNECEIHRELQMTPNEAERRATADGRNVLRPFRRDPWWPYVWSLRSEVKVDTQGTVPVGGQRLKIPLNPCTKVTRCEHPDGSYTFLAKPPGEGGKPIVLMRYENS